MNGLLDITGSRQGSGTNFLRGIARKSSQYGQGMITYDDFKFAVGMRLTNHATDMVNRARASYLNSIFRDYSDNV